MSVLALLVLALASTDATPPEIHHEPLTTAYLKRQVLVQAEITDPSGVFSPSLSYRLAGTDKFTQLEMKTTDGLTFVAAIPPAFVTGDLEYYLEAFDNAGNGPALAGSAKKPYLVTAEEPPPDAVAGELPIGPIATAGSGALVAIAGVALYFVAAGQIAALDAKYGQSGLPRLPGDASATRAAQDLGRLGSGLGVAGGVVAAGGVAWWLIPAPSTGDGGDLPSVHAGVTVRF